MRGWGGLIEGYLKLRGKVSGNVAEVNGSSELLTRDADAIAALGLRASEATAANILAALADNATGADLAALQAVVATEVTLALLKGRADLLGTESTLAALKARGDLLGTEATLAALKNRGDLLGTEATLLALKNRGDLLGTEATLAALKARADLLGTEVTSAAAKAVLDTIFARLADGNQIAKLGKVAIGTPALEADGAIAYLLLDAYKRVRTLPNVGDNLAPWQTRIRRVGSISTSSTAVVAVNDATAVPTNAPPQNSLYTVPPGRKFLFKEFRAIQLTKAGTDGIVAVIRVDGVIRHVLCTVGGGSIQFDTQDGVVYPAGSVITINGGVTGGTLAMTINYAGIEEPA